jgi:MHS family proline/betaine transporter-like MFS transporter
MSSNFTNHSMPLRPAMTRSSPTSTRSIAAALLGNTLEWFDFAVYGYVASIIARKFFPPGDEVAALLATFAVFGVGFVVRPLGAIVIGRLGDTRGRKFALLTTILLMAGGTGLIGITPTYDTIGIGAPLLLLIARMMQGFSVGGEFATSIAFIVEWAPPERRGLYGSLQQCSTVGGFLLGSGTAALLNSVMETSVLENWGWRIPFLVGALIGIVGLYMRRGIEETPAFARAVAAPQPVTGEAEASPIVLAGRTFAFSVLWTVLYFIFLFYMPTFTQVHAGLGRTEALWANSAGLLLCMAAIPLAGLLSDKVGRRPLLIVCAIFFLVLPYPLFSLIKAQGSMFHILWIQLAVGLAIALYAGPAPATMAEIFRTKGRSTYMSVGYALSATIFGGFAPFIATWLIATTGSPLSPAFYVMAAAAISLVAVLTMRETAHRPLG